MLFSPDLFVVGGESPCKHEKYLPLLDLKTPIVPAQALNTAGIVGAAYQASRASRSERSDWEQSGPGTVHGQQGLCPGRGYSACWLVTLEAWVKQRKFRSCPVRCSPPDSPESSRSLDPIGRRLRQGWCPGA